jgi:hypothetical protein
MKRVTLMDLRRANKREARLARQRDAVREKMERRHVAIYRRAIPLIRAHLYCGAWFDQYEHMADDRYRKDPLAKTPAPGPAPDGEL